ncbi:hypothetical protein C8R45DRAFT_479673 [Mycena sanguinolenta]|nr:hypothetical protein C8R45DRAFT_479673 [Mycena sanguinolenta]
MSAVAHFPHELMDIILIHHAEDFDCLTACSLVCRAWFFSSRSLLFKTCFLLPKNIRRFRDLVLSPGCTILPHVRTLDVDRSWLHADDNCFNEVAGEMHHHKHIHTLEMTLFINHNISEAQSDTFFCQGFITAFAHITSLNLTCDFESAGHSLVYPLIDMLCMFPALQNLEMRGIFGNLEEPQTYPPPPRGLSNLVLGETSVDLILRWLLRTGHLPHLESLALPRVRDIHVQTVREALPRLGNALRHLKIELTQSFRADAYSMYGLSLRHTLRTLSIRDPSRSKPWRSDAQFDPNPMLALIYGLVAPALESFSLELDLQLYRKMDWAGLDAFLSPERFPRLRRVTLAYQSRYSRDRMFLSQALPLLEASGILRTVG